MAKTVFDVLIEKLEEHKTNAGMFLTAGSPTDYSQYREVVGLIRGLTSAQQVIEDLARSYGEEDDRD